MNGLCECGCGGITSIAPKTSARENVQKGEHRKFCFGHQNRRFITNHSEEPQRGQFIHAGYVYVLAPKGHPHPTNKRYIKRCRLVMEGVLERYLERREQVHHKNMDRSDDRPENLEAMLLSDHNRLHRKIRRMIDGRK
jgi:hypothetical protein